jgi:hypothetical protein
VKTPDFAAHVHCFDTHHVLVRASEPVQYGRNRKKVSLWLTSTLNGSWLKPACSEKDMIMRFYNSQHEFYCGIDLHANSMHVCVVDQRGNKQLHRNFNTKTPERFLDSLSPYRGSDLIVGCESTFNWYWLADLCSVENLPFLLGHALYLKAIHGGKTKSDRIDSEKLAMPLRGLTIAQDSARTSPMKPSQSKDPDSRANPLIGKVQQYDAMENPLAKNCKLLPREPSALLDFKGHTDVMRPLTCW